MPPFSILSDSKAPDMTPNRGTGLGGSHFRDNARGIVAMIAAMSTFILNDTLVKLASDEGMPTGEILFLRGAIAVVLIGWMVAARGELRQWRTLLHGTVAWRTLGEVGATLIYLTALFQLPIANATVLMQTVPLASVAAAAWFLGEKVGFRRWTAIAIGFIGVVIVVQPGVGGFSVYSLLVLVAVGFVTLRDLITRSIPDNVPILLLTAATSAVVGLVGLVLGIFEDWVWPTWEVWLYVAGSSVTLTIAYYLIVVAMRAGEIGVVAPFRYVVIVWAIILGFLIWGDRPNQLTLIGTAIIIATGVYTFHRERQLSRRNAASEALEI
jgi:drug/metabolite transporter (DMT)-like permease